MILGRNQCSIGSSAVTTTDTSTPISIPFRRKNEVAAMNSVQSAKTTASGFRRGQILSNNWTTTSGDE
ncbi:MAG: hypothetical protein KDN05_13365 [Verrucomicrobiae bacterium]|nr:hypothetical protein [Verrucomicrobiae bacterium]